MKGISLGIGVAAGMAMAILAVNCMYPDVSRRMMRDGKKVARCAKRRVRGIF